MLSPPAVEHDSDVCELETGGRAKVPSGLTHLLKETKTPGCTEESVWPRPTSGRYASIMRPVLIRGRSGDDVCRFIVTDGLLKRAVPLLHTEYCTC